jgi:hypothetical protein
VAAAVTNNNQQGGSVLKRTPLIAVATLTLLMTSAADAAEPNPNAQQEVLMPEVQVTGDAPARPHPQDSNFSERPLGCVEVVTPRGTGNETGGYHQARYARAGIPVIPNLNDPASAAELSRKGPTYHQVTPPGQEGTNKCRR